MELFDHLVLSDRELVILTGLLALLWICTRSSIRRERFGLQQQHAAVLERVTEENRGALNERNQFIRNLSYELKTPLDRVVYTVQLLLDKQVPDWQVRHLQDLRESASTLSRVVSRLIDHSALMSSSFELAQLSFSLRKKIDNFVAELDETSELRVFQLPYEFDELPTERFEGDPIRLGEMLDTMIEVISSYSTNESVVCLQVGARPEGARGAEIKVVMQAEQLSLTTSDRERLLKALDTRSLSEEFHYGDSSFGLFLCNSLAQLMSGGLKISVPSENELEFSLSIRMDFSDRDTSELSLPQLPDDIPTYD